MSARESQRRTGGPAVKPTPAAAEPPAEGPRPAATPQPAPAPESPREVTAQQSTRAATGHSVLQPADQAPPTAPPSAPADDEVLDFDLDGVDFEELEADDARYPAAPPAAAALTPAAAPTAIDLLTAPAHAATGGPPVDHEADTDLDGEADFAVFDLKDLEAQEVWQFKEVTPTAPEAAGAAVAEALPETEAEPPPEPAAAVEAQVEPLPTYAASPGEPVEEVAPAPLEDVPPETTAEGTEAFEAASLETAGEAAPAAPAGAAPATTVAPAVAVPAAAAEAQAGVAPEAARILEDLRHLGLQDTPEPPATSAARPAPGPAVVAAAPAAPPIPMTPPATEDVAAAGAEGGRERRPVPAIRRALEALLLALDRPFRDLSPRVKNFAGQMAISMAATASFLLILHHLGLLPR